MDDSNTAWQMPPRGMNRMQGNEELELECSWEGISGNTSQYGHLACVPSWRP